MWARRIGCPALWPSRIKVLVMSWLLLGCVYTFFNYLRTADVDYLDLSIPHGDAVKCGYVEPACRDQSDPLACILQAHEPFMASLDTKAAFAERECPMQVDGQCKEVALPLTLLQGDMAQIHTVDRMCHPLRLWTCIFGVLMLLQYCFMIIHDLALLQERCRPKILSLRSAKTEMPCLWKLIASFACRGIMGSMKRKVFFVWIAILPVWAVLQVFMYLFVVYPLSLHAAFCWWCPLGPIRVSRVLVFQTSIFICLWALVFMISILIAEEQGLDEDNAAGLDDYYNMNVYAIFWNAPSYGTGCVCYCEYRLKAGVVQSLTFFSLVVACWAASMAFRGLKGLRRPNWGNLFTILYTVPIELFPVIWERPAEEGGGPIQHRKDGEPVQGEPAFDPFCLMDEQPESGRTRVNLCPVNQTGDQVARWCYTRDPTSNAVIGCCGFPQKTQMHTQNRVTKVFRPSNVSSIPSLGPDVICRGSSRRSDADPESPGHDAFIRTEARPSAAEVEDVYGMASQALSPYLNGAASRGTSPTVIGATRRGGEVVAPLDKDMLLSSLPKADQDMALSLTHSGEVDVPPDKDMLLSKLLSVDQDLALALPHSGSAAPNSSRLRDLQEVKIDTVEDGVELCSWQCQGFNLFGPQKTDEAAKKAKELSL